MGAAFYTDASVFGPTFGFPIVICGPGEISMMHKPNEYVKIEELLLAPKIFADWAVKLRLDWSLLGFAGGGII